MSLPVLFIVTSSSKKFNELSLELKDYFVCERKDINIVEIQGTPEEIILDKAKKAYKIIKNSILVDDVSFHLDVLGGFPGPYMKDFASALSAGEVANLFEGTCGTAVSRLILMFSEDEYIAVEGSVRGEIVKPAISKGYGFEPFLIPEGSKKTFSQMSVEEKNKYSHRGRAVRKLKDALK